MPSILWTRYWFDAQVYDVFERKLFQDNKSAMPLEKNGKAPRNKHTKHINIRYYFVTDCIEKYELSLEWCPTENMIRYFMTEPTQGMEFKRLLDHLMGVTQDVFRKKCDKNRHLLGFIPHTYFFLFGLFINICTYFIRTLLHESLFLVCIFKYRTSMRIFLLEILF